MAEPPKTGKVRLQDYEAEAFLQQLEPVVEQLREELPTAGYDRKALGILIGQLMQFQEDALGINAIQGQHKKQPKIPSKLLHNFSPRGPVFVMAAACYHFRARNPSVKRIDFLSPAKRTENVNLWSSIRAALHREGHLKPPRVHVHGSCGQQADQLQRIVSDMGGEVAQSADAPGVTQIIYPFGPAGDPDDGVQYMRVLDRRGPDARVHWWYWPDSYDSWIPNDQAPDADDPDKPSRGPRKVYLRWLTDSRKFNEWMNPVDYETEEYQKEQDALEQNQTTASRRQGDGIEASGSKRKFSPGGEGGTKRSAPRQRIDPGSGWHKAGPDQQLPPHVAWNQVTDAERQTLDGSANAENISRGQQRGPARTHSYKLPQSTGPDPVSAGVPPPEVELTQELYKVPCHASWFGYNDIHAVERKSVPDFFNGKAQSKTPKVYKEYRNFMINKYREDVKRTLTFTECKRLLAGDAMGVFKVWQFLNSWGIINYQAGAGADEDADGVPLKVQPAGPPSLLKVLAAGPNNGDALFKFTPAQNTDGIAAAAAGGLEGLQLITRRDRYGKSASQPSNGQVKYFCNETGVECSECRYHCVTMPDVDLSPAAYADGKFPPGCSSKDFVRIDQADFQTQPQEWSDQETLLLLEGLELHKDRWADIADHVGTKSQVQCILHFLQLPIEDEFLDELEDKGRKAQGMQGPSQQLDNSPGGTPGIDLIPFADTGNPVLSQVAFLAAMVGPKVAAAAAQRALEVLAEEDPAVAAEAGALHQDTTQDGQPSPDRSAAPDAPVSSSRMRVAAATALGAAAVKAKILAEAEERELQRQVQVAVDAQIQKVQLKLNSMSQLEDALEKERSIMEAQRHQMLQSRVSLQEQQLQLQKQAHQLHQAAQRFPGLAANGAGQPNPSSGPSTNTVPAVAPPAAQPNQPGPT
ncbi:hypothetical protein ABBQ38_003035 [Trebouxia sp. C0009 RCD-2024]